jgi:hypothetical protein
MHNNQFCLHIGSGLVAPKEWINIDASPSLLVAKIPVLGSPILSAIGGPKWPNLVHYGDIVKGLKIRQESCELIFAAHVLEHLTLSDFHLAMSNIYSYLKPGGIFRSIVPDLEQYVSLYHFHQRNSSMYSKAAHEFMKESSIGCQGSRRNLIQRLRQAFSNSRHQWMWDEPSLTDAFAQHRFRNIRRCHYGDWSDERFASVEKESNYVSAICIEGTK